MKMRPKLAMNAITVCLLIYGIFQMKSFLNYNFVENDTDLKRRVDKAFQQGKEQKFERSATIQLPKSKTPSEL